MQIITLTSDWHKNDFYVASIKGRILSQCPDTRIVDVSHQVQAFNILQAAFVLKNCYRNFPDGTIHIIAVNSEPDNEKSLVLVKASNHYFITCDNGIFGLLLDEEPDKIYKIKGNPDDKDTFVSLNVFSRVACDLVKGKKPESIGTPQKTINKHMPVLPAIDESLINGSVIYIDSYRNAVTNIPIDLFKRIAKNRPFEIFIQSNHYKINKINKTYNETSAGEILVLFNSAGLLEIAINKGNAADLLNLNTNSIVRVKFYSDK
jgi:S-adenosylmethionine hydrolase